MKKINKIQIFRHIVQLILFILLPGLYILAFGELKSVYEMIIKGNFNFMQALPSIVELFTVVLGTIILGRFFCGWMCAFGAYNDLIHEISKNIFKVKVKVSEEVDGILKYVKYIVLSFIIVFMWSIGTDIFQSSSPWDAFAQITDFKYVLTNFTIGFILLALITLGAVFIERFFCRYLCPLGAIFTLISKVSVFKINKPNDKCGKCRACTNNCSMGIPLYKMNEVKGGECINCLKCVEVCPRSNANANILGENVDAKLASSVALAALVGFYGVNSFAGKALDNNDVSSSVQIEEYDINNNDDSSYDVQDSKYKDGTYTGSGTGFKGGTTTVSVTIKNGKISSIETVSNEDTPRFYDRVENAIMDEIVSSQSTDVDTVSGATFSSRGIISAVENALSKATL